MAFRLTTRLLPDLAQLGVPTATVINDTRVTFSGARGTVIALWTVAFVNVGAVSRDRIQMSFGGNADIVRGIPGRVWCDAIATREVILHNIAIYIDPAESSFTEMVTVFTGGGNLDIPAVNGTFTAMSFPQEEGGGPVITVS